MSGEAQSASELRCLIRATCTDAGSGEDIANIDSAPLPDGAQCFVLENRQLYRFRKHSTKAAASTDVIVPIAGGGRWVREGTVAGAGALFARSTGVNTVPNGSVWAVSTTSNFGLTLGAGGSWVFNPSSCIATYSGPVSRYLVTLAASLTPEAGAAAYLGISLNDDLTGTDTGFTEGVEFVDNSATGMTPVTCQRLVVMEPGSTIKPKFYFAGAVGECGVERLTMSAIAV